MDPIALWPGDPPGRADQPSDDNQRVRAAERPVLEPYLVPGGGSRPLVVVVPGGGYGGRAPHEGEPIARWLNGSGLHAAVCHYRVAPWRHPAPLHDALRAVRLVRHHAASWGVDPSRVGILGFSAGGHLAVSAATLGDEPDPLADAIGGQPGRPDALIACYAVVTFGSDRHDGSMRNLLGANPDPGLRARLSLERSVTSANPPAFIWHSVDDAAVPVENALLLAAAYARCGRPFALHVYPHAPHGIGLGLDRPGTARRWTEDCAAWLAELGWR